MRRELSQLGGGAWTLPGNRDLIASAGGTSVWLDAPFNLCWQRIVAGIVDGILDGKDGRPLAPTEQEALGLYTARRAAYAPANLHVEATIVGQCMMNSGLLGVRHCSSVLAWRTPMYLLPTRGRDQAPR